MAKRRRITIDFESDAIEQRPYYPPEPVGFSIKRPGDKKSKYWAFGHDSENNCTKAEARAVLLDAWKSGEQLLFQNAKFDVDVAQVHMGMPDIGGERIDDTMYLLALYDPYAPSLSLKPSAERILGMAPEERDVLKDWIVEHVPEAHRKPSEWYRYIRKAPGKLTGDYADGDVIRTEKLDDMLYPDICKRGMQGSYDRERKLMPILLRNEREGIRIDLPKLELDVKLYQLALETADNWLRKRLKTPNLNVDADQDFADALERCKVVTGFVMTAKGNRSVSKKNLTVNMFKDPQVASVFGYRNKLSTCMSTFMLSWLETARATGGIIHTTWNQVRQSHHESLVGARTMRMSTTPNFQNVPKNWKRAFGEGYVHPAFLKVPELPFMRKYFLPDPGEVWGRRDYNQQELRILAHFEDGSLCRSYNADPRFDHHQEVQDLLKDAGHDLVRDSTKILNFQDIYGGGAPALAAALGITVDQAAQIKKAKRRLLPDLAALDDAIKKRAKAGLPVRTWGGSQIFPEPGKFVAKLGRFTTFEYKVLNALIQRSAAECSKESVIRYDAHPKKQGRFLVQVHDENNISAPPKRIEAEMKLLREVMQSVEFDVPMLSDGEIGPNWGSLQKLEEK